MKKIIQFEANLFILVMVSEPEQQTTMAGSQKASGSEKDHRSFTSPLYSSFKSTRPCFGARQIKWGQLSIMEQSSYSCP